MIRAKALTPLILLLCGVALGARAAGPVHDPFLEDFRLGRYDDPETLKLARGFPADLWRPCRVDTAWVVSARALLESGPAARDRKPEPLLIAWGEAPVKPGGLETWRASRAAMLEAFLGRGEVAVDDPSAELGRDWLSRQCFRALAAGDSAGALGICRTLADAAARTGRDAAFTFVWDLRRRALAEARGRIGDPRDPWPALFELGPFDRNSGWAIWVARRRFLGLPLLTDRHRTAVQAGVVAGLRRTWLDASDLAAGGFAYETTAGLGALVLEGKARSDFMARYDHPPWAFTPQGWWVRGARLAARGDAAVYEKLAADDHLRSGWRMDLWRRASERRLLHGRWSRGIADLERAAGLARYEAGSSAMRRRVREWTAQALALAAARGNDAAAARIRKLGREGLPESERKAFRARTDIWYATPAQIEDSGQEGTAVLAGLAGDLGSGPGLPPADDLRLGNWRSWARTVPAGLGARESPEATGDPEAARAAALDILARQGSELDIPFSLWDGILLHEVYLGGAGEAFAPGSLAGAVKDAVRVRPGSDSFWLGVALALQDLRAVVSLGAMGVGRDLTPADRQRFLYPVPAFGPVREALDAADSPVDIMLAVARNESLFDPGARSRAGALGWLQIMPFHYPAEETAKGPVWSDPAVSIAKGDALLQENIRRYRGDPYRVLAAYNAGPRAADRWDGQLGGSASRGQYLAWIGYTETRGYVEKVLKDRNIYAGILAPGRAQEDSAD